MRWPWSRKTIESPSAFSLTDPSWSWMTPGGTVDFGDIAVNETTAMGLSALYRAVSLISGTLASLPMPTYREVGDGDREKVKSIFDDPDPGGQTVFEWKETLFLHLLIHGRAGALKVRTEAGALYALQLVHPLCWSTRLPTNDEYAEGKVPAGGLWFDVNMQDGTTISLTSDEFWYVPAASFNGKTSTSMLCYARTSMATTIAADQAAGNMFSRGALLSGIASPPKDDGMTAEEAREVKRQVNSSMLGSENAGTIAVVNFPLNFTPWTMTATDAQFLQSRQFQIEEISRWTGVPPHLLMQTEKQTSWGTGVEEQNRALGRTVLLPWAQRVEHRASRLLAAPRWVEFEFAGLERPSPDREIELLLAQVAGGLLTVNEARAYRNLPPLPESEEAPDRQGEQSEEQGGGQDEETR